MAGVMAAVDQRTDLVGKNRLEILMFKLSGRQTYAINVFKIQEVLQMPSLTAIPHSHPCVCGVMYIRGNTIPVINLSQAISLRPLPVTKESTVIVTEYNRSVQGFLVGGVDRIINMNWEQIEPPPKSTGKNNYLTAITQFNEDIVEIIDVEKVLSEISPYSTDVSEDILDEELISRVQDKFVLVVDDSPVAIAQVKGTLEKMGLKVYTASNGLLAYNMLKDWAENNENMIRDCLMVLTDAEMPEMDGYRLTTEIRSDSRLSQLCVIMHTSLSGTFNLAMVEKVGCDDFLSKFQPDNLAKKMLDRIRNVISSDAE